MPGSDRSELPALSAGTVPIHRVGELMQIGADRIEEPQDRAQANVALAGLKPRQIGAARAHPLGYLLLREPGSLA
jgi:hypothetical protein